MARDPGDGGLPPTPPLLPKGIGDILNAAFRLYKENWQGFFAIVAVVAVPLTLLEFLLIDVSFKSGTFGRAAFGGALATLASVLIYGLLAGAMGRAAIGSIVGMPVSVNESVNYGLARFGPILWVGFLFGLAVFVGFFAVIIGAVIVAVKLAVSVPVLIVEDRRGTQALSRSWDLTTGHFWHVLGTVFVAGIITRLVSAILQAPFAGSGWVGPGIGASVAQVVTAPFTAIVSILVYLDLRARKESLTSDGLRAELARSA